MDVEGTVNVKGSNPLPAANSRRPFRHPRLWGIRCSQTSSGLGSPAAVAEGGRWATLHIMRNAIITGVMAATVLIIGCGKKSSSGSDTPRTAQADAASSASPVSQPALTAWQQGDQAAAVYSFLAADWSARPLFTAGSTLSLTEDQFKALSAADRQAKSGELTAQLDSFKRLAAAVAQAGRDAASKGDAATAKKYFTSLKQCGTALESPDCLQLVQLVGKAIEKMSDKEMAKIGQ